jgi:hypothetical protein
MVVNGDAGTVRPDDFHHDCQAKPGASAASGALPAPETVEDARAVLDGYAGPAIRDPQRAVGADLDNYLGSGRRMRQRIFDQVAQGISNRSGVSGDRDFVLCAGQCDRPAARQRKMGHGPNYLRGDLAQIGSRRNIERDRVEACDAQQLLD